MLNYLCSRYGAKSFDLTPYTRVWETRSGNTYIIKQDPFRIFHRYPNGEKHNYWGKKEGATKFIDYVEATYANRQKH